MDAKTKPDAYGALIEPTTLKIQRLLPGPIERVWAYLTDSDLRRKWLAAGAMEMKVGAPFELLWRNGEIKTERKDNWTEVTVKADGRTMKANVPNTSMFPVSARDKERKSDILVRRVDVEHVRMIGASCGE